MAPIMVRATKPGVYGGGRRRVGDEFPIDSAKDLGSWMVKVQDAPAKGAKGKEPEKEKEPEKATPDPVI